MGAIMAATGGSVVHFIVNFEIISVNMFKNLVSASLDAFLGGFWKTLPHTRPKPLGLSL